MITATDYKAFLDQEILGNNVGTVQARRFQPLNLTYPSYSGKFPEVFPTLWATAYAFQKRLEAQDAAAVEEWVCLYLLQNFGILHLAEFDQSVLEKAYDKDLWPALKGTYPQHDSIPSMRLLRTDKGTVVGGYYPGIFFFPSCGRADWRDDKLIQRYLSDDSLSWSLCSEHQLKDRTVKDKFHEHLLKVPLQGVLAATMQSFCRRHFGDSEHLDTAVKLTNQPATWPLADGRDPAAPPDPDLLLAAYPLKRNNKRGGVTYFLLEDMPTAADSWMTGAIKPGLPAPTQYRKPVGAGPRVTEIIVEFALKRISCPLGPNDEVVMLRDCFIERPAMCSISDDSQMQQVKVGLHRIAADGRGVCTTIKKGDVAAVLLAPINDRFLEHFHDIVVKPESYEVSLKRDLPGDTVTWRFKIEGQTVSWQASPEYLKDLSNASVALWPPRIATEWGVYVAYGSGVRVEVCGQWQLIGPLGVTSSSVTLAPDEYVSIMNNPTLPDCPYGLLLRDNGSEAGGVLFLDMPEERITQTQSARLSVDFGTSNTSLAFDTTEQPTTLKFSLQPLMLWGPQNSETVGFVPFNWGGKAGYFPTVLLSRLIGFGSDLHAIKTDIKLEHLFRVDIPGLHQKVEEYMLKGLYSDVWSLHDNLKWNSNDTKPWRSLFISLALLYAHAELYFTHKARVVAYTFTYPLAFGETERDLYIQDALTATNKVRSFCYPGDPGLDISRFFPVDESSAIANFIEARPNRETLELFIDTGGGTTDIALRYNKEFLVLDSLKVAGKSFFQFARTNFERNMSGGSQFKKHLASLLTDRDGEELVLDGDRLKQLDTFYSLAINRLDDLTFRRKENNILPPPEGRPQPNRGMGANSYQRYRSRLFFQQTLAYALIQACAAAVANKLEISNGIKLILGGNAWGLLAFAELERKNETIADEAEEILGLIKRNLSPTLPKELRRYLGDGLSIAGVILLNGERLSEAKTAVARGALSSLEGSDSRGAVRSAYAYSGLSIHQLKVNGCAPFDLLWCDLWGKKGLGQKLKRKITDIQEFEFERKRQVKEADAVLRIFTGLGNPANPDRNLLPDQEWVNINSTFQETETYLGPDGLNIPPLNYFVSEMLYPGKREHHLLNVLAQQNNSFERR